MVYKKSNAFTLVEIMIVIAMIALIASFVGPRIMKQFGKGKKSATQGLIRNLKAAISEYEIDKGNKPSGPDAMKKLVESGVLQGFKVDDEGIPVDAWGHPLTLNAPPQVFKQEKGYRFFEIISYGETGDADANKTEWIVDGE